MRTDRRRPSRLLRTTPHARPDSRGPSANPIRTPPMTSIAVLRADDAATLTAAVHWDTSYAASRGAPRLRYKRRRSCCRRSNRCGGGLTAAAQQETKINVLTLKHLCQYTAHMPTTSRSNRQTSRERRVSRTYRLPLSKLNAAKRALGAATATETIERALDLVVFQRELVDGTRAMLGVEIASPDPDR
jgi:hypothetical protein